MKCYPRYPHQKSQFLYEIYWWPRWCCPPSRMAWGQEGGTSGQTGRHTPRSCGTPPWGSSHRGWRGRRGRTPPGFQSAVMECNLHKAKYLSLMNISNAMEVCSQLKLIRFPMWFWIAEILLFVKLKFQLILVVTQTLMLNFLLESSRRSSTSFFLFSSSMKMTHWTYLDLVSSPMFKVNLSDGKLSFVSTRNCSKVVKFSFLQRSDVSSSNL